jgi:hypothetical protein
MATQEIQSRGGTLTRPKKGEVLNPNGRPVGSQNKKTKLKKLLKDIIHLHNGKVNDYTKKLLYQLYEVTISDLCVDVVTESVTDLYFIESDFGIKIGFSKKVTHRLKQIQSYAPSAKIYKVIKHGGMFERKLHKKFAKQNSQNNPIFGVEWFYKNDDLMSFIDSINCVNDLVTIYASNSVKQLQLNL